MKTEIDDLIYMDLLCSNEEPMRINEAVVMSTKWLSSVPGEPNMTKVINKDTLQKIQGKVLLMSLNKPQTIRVDQNNNMRQMGWP